MATAGAALVLHWTGLLVPAAVGVAALAALGLLLEVPRLRRFLAGLLRTIERRFESQWPTNVND